MPLNECGIRVKRNIVVKTTFYFSTIEFSSFGISNRICCCYSSDNYIITNYALFFVVSFNIKEYQII